MPELTAVSSSIATVGATLDRAAETLRAAGISYPQREAAWLWEVAAGLPAGQAWLAREQRAAAESLQRFDIMITRRTRGTPFAYAAGQMSFRRLTLAIDDRALIPRPETEGLVELVLQWAERPPLKDSLSVAGGSVADIGTGSGCIALSLALEGRFDRVVATEPSPGAAALARANAARCRLSIDVREGDLLEPLGAQTYRAIVSNPPYLTDDEWTALDHAVRAFEPRLALTSGPDGLDATRALLRGAGERLEPGGLLALEIDERRAAAVRDAAHASGWDRVRIVPDLFGRPRYALMNSRGRTS